MVKNYKSIEQEVEELDEDEQYVRETKQPEEEEVEGEWDGDDYIVVPNFNEDDDDNVDDFV